MSPRPLIPVMIALSLTAANYAKAEDHQTGHDKFHTGFYEGLRQPGTGASCCSGRDCAPSAYRTTINGPEVKVDGKWIVPPADRTMELTTPDGGAHVCASSTFGQQQIFCVILPRGAS